MEARNQIEYICVFCGSSEKAARKYAEAAIQLAECIVGNGYGLVFGGANVGLMGLMANIVKKRGGQVKGIITQDVKDMEVGYPGIELVMTDNLEERKKKMMALSAGCISLPGGLGTFDELNWLNVVNQFDTFKGKEVKPHAVFNIDGYYKGTIDQINRGVDDGFIDKKHAQLIYFSDNPTSLVQHISNFQQPKPDKSRWWEERDMPYLDNVSLFKRDSLECREGETSYLTEKNKTVYGKKLNSQ